jgi:CubicO group peptidase (beta-lactamase class C family)
MLETPWPAACLAIAALAAAEPAPPGPWQQVLRPDRAGWSEAGLEAARRKALDAGTAAIVLVHDGRVVAAWGAVDLPLKTHSIRKSLYSLVIGVAHDAGRLRLERSLGDLGIDDLQPLSAAEKEATVRELMAARSGVYHPAAYETESNAARRPERGSAAPGAAWYYNNWDFNVLPEAYRRETGQALECAFAERIASPLGMEDFVPDRDVFHHLEPTVSRWDALLFRLSARDLARVGQLVVDGGRWDGRQVVSREWIEQSTRPTTVFPPGHERGGGNGFGLMWWTLPARPDATHPWEREDQVMAKGAGGHAMLLVPALRLVLVHRTDTDSGRGVSDAAAAEVMGAVLSAWRGPASAPVELGPLVPQPLGERPRARVRLKTPVPDELARQAAGRYRAEAGPGEITLFVHEARLFARRAEPRVQEAELFVDGDVLFSPDAPLEVRLLERSAGGVRGIEVALIGHRSLLRRVD